MLKSISTPQSLATITGASILAASTNANVLNTGGWFSSHAMLVAALSLGVFAGARVIGAGAGKVSLVIIAALLAGEMFNFSATAERIVVERENGAAPLKAQREAHDAAERRLREVSAAPARSARLAMAAKAKQDAEAAAAAEAGNGGCKSVCRMKQAQAEAAATELKAAFADAESQHAAAIEAAKAEVKANPLPASATPLADRLGWAPWVLDLVMAGLLSIGANGLAGTLIAFGAHSVVRLNETTETGTDFDTVSEFDATKLRTMVAGEFPEPTPPKPGKRKKVTQLPANVVSFSQHPVVTALKKNGGSVSSNRELASLMAVTEGEASKRRQEVENRLEITRVGKEMRIALKA